MHAFCARRATAAGRVDLRALSKGACAASDDGYVSAISWVGGVLVVGTSDGEVALVGA